MPSLDGGCEKLPRRRRGREAIEEMSRRSSKGAAATSRRTRRAERQQQQPLPPLVFASNPVFVCEDDPGDLLKPRYGTGSLHALVRGEVLAGSGDDGVKRRLLPLPLPPSRTHLEGRGGTGLPAWHVGPTIVVGPHGRVMRMVAPAQQDPFLAAYVACTKGKSAAPATKQGQPQPQPKRNTKKKRGEATAMRAGCGMWNGWAAGASYAGVMSCRLGSAVTVLHGGAPAPPPAADAPAESPAHPRLDLSRPPAVLPGRRRTPN
ncbi:hypothetical protein GUJ93_ZPchr0003g17508 [Zizania palustris]|uniref:Uncharacterized protein n=1 Tax=Zizania palustris TaxID=103762 RepID=A0A8J5SB87_ZIZPA|nr:hypothetical protein GUJ93_ZPchr0003g17508 [Zizania palustris]